LIFIGCSYKYIVAKLTLLRKDKVYVLNQDPRMKAYAEVEV